MVIKEQTNIFFLSVLNAQKWNIFRGIAVFSRQGVVELPHLPLRDKESFSKGLTCIWRITAKIGIKYITSRFQVGNSNSAAQLVLFYSVMRKKIEHMISQLPSVLLKVAIMVIKEQTNKFFSRSEREKVDIFRGIAVFSRQGVVELPHLPLRDKESFSKGSTSI